MDNIVNEAQVAYISRPTLRVILGDSITQDSLSQNDAQLIALTRVGIHKSTLKPLADYLGITMEELSAYLHTSYRNLQRKDDNDLLDTLKSERVIELATLVQRGIEVLGSKSAFIQWIHAPLLVLDNQRPMDFLDTTFGMNIILRLLGRIEHGVYS